MPQRTTARIRNDGGSNNGGGNNAGVVYLLSLLIYCGFDILSRFGPFGRIVASVTACVLLLAVVITITVVAVNNANSANSADSANSSATFLGHHIPYSWDFFYYDWFWLAFVFVIFAVGTPFFFFPTTRYVYVRAKQDETPVVPGVPIAQSIASMEDADANKKGTIPLIAL